MESGTDTATLIYYAGAAGLLLAAAVITAFKGKWGFVVLGLFFAIFWIVGASRLAKPGSSWARTWYSPEKQKRARLRFADTSPTGMPLATKVGGELQCKTCSKVVHGLGAAATHMDTQHPEIGFSDLYEVFEEAPRRRRTPPAGARSTSAETPGIFPR